MDSITVRRDTKDMNSKQPDRFPRMNCIVVFNKTKDRILLGILPNGHVGICGMLTQS